MFRKEALVNDTPDNECDICCKAQFWWQFFSGMMQIWQLCMTISINRAACERGSLSLGGSCGDLLCLRTFYGNKMYNNVALYRAFHL